MPCCFGINNPDVTYAATKYSWWEAMAYIYAQTDIILWTSKIHPQQLAVVAGVFWRISYTDIVSLKKNAAIVDKTFDISIFSI